MVVLESMKANSIKLSVNLVDAAQYELNLLQETDAASHLRQESNIYLAIQRYETFWLPLRAAHLTEKLEAPLDVAWIWHCHTLAPAAYQRDCLSTFGVVLPRQHHSPFQRKRALSNAYRLWAQRYPNEPFDAPQEVPDEFTFKPLKITFNLFDAAKRHSDYYYQVSLMHYRDGVFLKRAVLRYKKFLHLKKLHEDELLVPTYDVDLMWRAHQAHPVEYKADCDVLLGYLLDRGDTEMDRGDGSTMKTLEAQMGELWQTAYNEPFVVDGAMSRGKTPRGQVKMMKIQDLQSMTKEYYRIEICRATVLRKEMPDNEHVIFFALKTLLKSSDEIQMREESLTLPQPLRFKVTVSEMKHLECRVLIRKRMPTMQAGVEYETKMDLFGLVAKVRAEAIPEEEEVTADFQDHSTGTMRASLVLGIRMIPVGPQKVQISMKWKPKAVKLSETLSIPVVSLYPHLEGSVADVLTSGVTVTHYAASTGPMALKVRVIYSKQPVISAVQVMNDKNEVLAYSHLIGTEQLPLLTTVPWWLRDHSLNPEAERALIVKDNDGDVYLIRGLWVSSKGRGQSFGLMIFPHGHMEYSVLPLGTEAIQLIYVKFHEEMKIQYNEMDIDLMTGNITIENPNVARLPTQIVLAFSFGVLASLCIPKTLPASELTASDVEMKGLRELEFYSSAGYMVRDEIPTNYYLSSLDADTVASSNICRGGAASSIASGGPCLTKAAHTMGVKVMAVDEEIRI